MESEHSLGQGGQGVPGRARGVRGSQGGPHRVSPELCLSRLTNMICLSGRALSGIRRLLLADVEEGGSDGALQGPGGLVLPPGATHHPVAAALGRAPQALPEPQIAQQALPEPQIAQDTRLCQL